jgi:hypothetical protein
VIVNGASSVLKESFAKHGAVLEELKTGIAFALQSSLVVNSKALQDLDVSVLDRSITICASHKATGACRLGLRWGQRHSEIACRPSPVSLDASILSVSTDASSGAMCRFDVTSLQNVSNLENYH